MLGDKELLFNDSGTAYVMFGIERRSWVSMGGPVGPEKERAELIWKFREQCDRYDGWPAFYQIEPEELPLYLDHGFSLLKLGDQ